MKKRWIYFENKNVFLKIDSHELDAVDLREGNASLYFSSGSEVEIQFENAEDIEAFKEAFSMF